MSLKVTAMYRKFNQYASTAVTCNTGEDGLTRVKALCVQWLYKTITTDRRIFADNTPTRRQFRPLQLCCWNPAQKRQWRIESEKCGMWDVLRWQRAASSLICCSEPNRTAPWPLPETVWWLVGSWTWTENYFETRSGKRRSPTYYTTVSKT